jgi:SAM-dependent methyltransferase
MADSPDNSGRRIVDIVRSLRDLPPYEAALAYRDAVRLEGEHVSAAIADPFVRGKYQTYFKRFNRPIPGRYFTDHNYARKLIPTLELVRSPGVQSILDAACGNGFEAVLFALHGKPVVANDISSARAAVTDVRRRFYESLLGDGFSLTVACGNAVELEGDRRFDLVYVQEAIHPAEEFLKQVAIRLLSAGGRLVVCDSNAWNPVTRLRIMRHLWQQRRTVRYFVEEQIEQDTGRKYLMAEERLFSPVSIRRAFVAAGLKPERIIMSGFSPPQVVQSSALLANRVDQWVSKLPGVNAVGGFYTAIARRGNTVP